MTVPVPVHVIAAVLLLVVVINMKDLKYVSMYYEVLTNQILEYIDSVRKDLTGKTVRFTDEYIEQQNRVESYTFIDDDGTIFEDAEDITHISTDIKMEVITIVSKNTTRLYAVVECLSCPDDTVYDFDQYIDLKNLVLMGVEE